MNRQKAKKQLDKRWKKMQQRFKKFLHTGHDEQLHQFRIGVKKVRSFLTLLEAGKKNQGLLKDFKPVKKIFKSAGVIRDAALHQKQAEEQGIQSPSFNQHEEGEKQQERKELHSCGRKYLHKMKEVKAKLHKHLHSVPDSKMQTFFQDQINITHRLVSRHNFTEQLHNARKALKHLLYNQQAFGQIRSQEPVVNFAYIDDLQEALGNWHDNKAALGFFSQKSGVANLGKLKTKNSVLQKAVTQKAKGFLQRIYIEKEQEGK